MGKWSRREKCRCSDGLGQHDTSWLGEYDVRDLGTRGRDSV